MNSFAMIIAIGFALLFRVESSLNCDNLQYEVDFPSLPSAIFIEAVGVCRMDSEGFSSMYVCGTTGNIGYVQFSSMNCSGDPAVYYPFKDFFALIGVQISNIQETCCTNNLCEFVRATTYNTTSCNSTKNGVATIDERIETIGACTSIPSDIVGFQQYTSCSNGTASLSGYIGSTDCSGPANITLQQTDGECDPGVNQQTTLSCEVAIDTCDAKYNPPTTNVTLNCDNIQYDSVGSLGLVHNVKAVGVCEVDTGYGNSSMLVCGTEGNIGAAIFSSMDCSGDPLLILPFSQIATQSGFSNVQSKCCSNNQCEFVRITEYNTTSCNQTRNVESSVEISIIGECEDFYGIYLQQYTSCSNGTASYDLYFDRTDCSGPANYTLQNDEECYQGIDTFFVQKTVSCEVATDTCMAKYNPATPSTTGSATSTTTGSSTTADSTTTAGPTNTGSTTTGSTTTASTTTGSTTTGSTTTGSATTDSMTAGSTTTRITTTGSTTTGLTTTGLTTTRLTTTGSTNTGTTTTGSTTKYSITTGAGNTTIAYRPTENKSHANQYEYHFAALIAFLFYFMGQILYGI